MPFLRDFKLFKTDAIFPIASASKFSKVFIIKPVGLRSKLLSIFSCQHPVFKQDAYVKKLRLMILNKVDIYVFFFYEISPTHYES